MTKVIQEDNDSICNTVLPWEELAGVTVLITGANGLIGSALVRAINALNEQYNLSIKCISHTRITHGSICFPLKLSESVDYIFHCAAMTRSVDMVSKSLEVINTSVDGTRNVLDFARATNCKSVVYLSSMEVYGQIDGEVTEDMIGYLDLSNPRSSYPESKRMCELLCSAYRRQYDVPVKIARLAQTFGAGTSREETRVFSQFARAAMNQTDIILHTEGRSLGNYCYIADTVTALFTLLFKGENGQTYNVANPDACMKICDMAKLVAQKYDIGITIKVPQDLEKLGYAATTGYKLNIDKISKLEWKPKYSLLDCYHRMIADWRDEK